MIYILPFQDGRDLVFCLVRDRTTMRYPPIPQAFPGLGVILIDAALMTFPTIDLAISARRTVILDE